MPQKDPQRCYARSLVEALSALEAESGVTDLVVESVQSENGYVALAEVLKTNSTLISLNVGYSMSSYRVSSAGIKGLAAALKVSASLKSLNINGQLMGPADVYQLCEALKENAVLTDLSLAGNQILSEGAAWISDVLKVNSSLVSLNLDCNRIGAEGGERLAAGLAENSSLMSLYLVGNRIGDENRQLIKALLERNAAGQAPELAASSAPSASQLKERAAAGSSPGQQGTFSQSQPPPVPEGWRAVWCAEEEDFYYWHLESSRTSWDHPEEMIVVGREAFVCATGEVGIVTAGNGHAFKLGGFWYLDEELEVTDDQRDEER